MLGLNIRIRITVRGWAMHYVNKKIITKTKKQGVCVYVSVMDT